MSEKKGRSKKVKGTKQTLEYVEAAPQKLHVKPIKCLNLRQKEFIKTINEKEVTVCVGPAGCGKTFMALWSALKSLEKKEVEQIVLVKSVVTIDTEEIGFLPGDTYEKMNPYMQSFFGNIDKIIGEDMRKLLVGQGKIKILPLAFCRGVNIDFSEIILDETQNISMSTFKSIITRIGKNSKYIIMGDTEQVDMKRKNQSALSKVLKMFENDDKVGTVTFQKEDCVRNPIIPHILDKIEEFEKQELDGKKLNK